jgi:MFS family permease
VSDREPSEPESPKNPERAGNTSDSGPGTPDALIAAEEAGPGVPEATQPLVGQPSRAARVGRTIRGIAVDFTPLRASRDFRLLWIGELISDTGQQITRVAIYIQIFRLTNSAAAVGLVGLVELVPLILASIGAGSIVDAVDRRKLLIATQLGYAVASTLLLLTALSSHPPLWLVYFGAGLTAAVGGISSPTRAAMIPRLVGPKLVPSAIALNQVMFNTTFIAGPALGGLIVAKAGLPWAYGIDAITYGATIGAAILMRPMAPEGTGPRASGLSAIREGIAYLKGRRVLQSTFVIDLVAMIFGMPRVLFPILAVQQFHRGDAVVGLLFSALGVGALLGAVSAGWVSRVRRQGRAVMVAVAVWGAGIVAFGLSGANLWVALVCLAVAGGADVISAVFRSTILQVSVPDALRGRLSAVHILVVTGGPRVGDVEAGIVAQLFSPFVSVVSGGIACVVGVVAVGLFAPQLWRYRAGERT